MSVGQGHWHLQGWPRAAVGCDRLQELHTAGLRGESMTFTKMMCLAGSQGPAGLQMHSLIAPRAPLHPFQTRSAVLWQSAGESMVCCLSAGTPELWSQPWLEGSSSCSSGPAQGELCSCSCSCPEQPLCPAESPGHARLAGLGVQLILSHFTFETGAFP